MQIKRNRKHAFTEQTSFVYLHLVFNSVEELNATKYDLKKRKKKKENYNTKVDIVNVTLRTGRSRFALCVTHDNTNRNTFFS